VPAFPAGNEGVRRALLAYGMMLNSVVTLLADKGIITKEEYGDFLHAQSVKHPELDYSGRWRKVSARLASTGGADPTPLCDESKIRRRPLVSTEDRLESVCLGEVGSRWRATFARQLLAHRSITCRLVRPPEPYRGAIPRPVHLLHQHVVVERVGDSLPSLLVAHHPALDVDIRPPLRAKRLAPLIVFAAHIKETAGLRLR
jgi:hypothetical protein